MKPFFKMHRAYLVTAPAFILYLVYLPCKKDMNTMVREKPDTVETTRLQTTVSYPVPYFDKTYTLSWVLGIGSKE